MLLVAKEYAKLYSPSEIFVMDLGTVGSEIRIIEYNCWNASGLYETNRVELYGRINEIKKCN